MPDECAPAPRRTIANGGVPVTRNEYEVQPDRCAHTSTMQHRGQRVCADCGEPTL